MKKSGKSLIYLFITTVLILSITLLGGCGKSNNQSQTSEAPSSDASSSEVASTEENQDTQESQELSSAEIADISEKSMQNFLEKIINGNYVMNSDGYVKTTVYSEDLVYFDYEDNSSYNDFAVMSVDDEVFQGIIEEDSITDVVFLKEGKAIDAANSKLPSYWLSKEVSDGNIYNLFYNDQDDPYKFVSYDTNVQDQLRAFAGYGNVALKYMHEVYLILDQENPTVAHIQAEVDDDEVARYYFDDIDITITFGDAQPDAAAEAWMKAPVYPETRTAWTESDLFIFNSVFLPEYGEKAIPYIPSASYALSVDEEHFISDDAVYIRDPHGTQEDADSYKQLLIQNGFQECEDDGEVWYRSLLRDETKCYSSIMVEYNDGLDVTARKYYEFPKYEGLDQINAMITANGYPELPATDAMRDLTATDTRFEQTESWLYFYDYNIVLYVYAHYDDYDSIIEYLDGYTNGLLEAGYEPVFVDGDEETIDHYRSADESMTFRYHFEDDDETLILLYKAEKCLSASETQNIIAAAGFPEIDLSAYITGRNHVKFEKVMYGKTYDSAVSFSMLFETSDDGDTFLNQYVEKLDEAGFLRVPPSDLGSNKNNGFTNEETGLGVAFDFIPDEATGETYIYFDFKSGIDFEAESEIDDGEDDGNKPILGSKYAEELETAH